jgi:A/G-specific adenine glycosylase
MDPAAAIGSVRAIVTGPRPEHGDHLAAIVDWWNANARELPWRSTRDMYAVWVSEVMSSQTTIARAAEAWTRWMARWPTVDALAEASLAEVLGEWQGLGYPRRARDLHRSAERIRQHGWPDDLTELPGVGAYTAAAIRCFALEQPVLPRDVNVNRVLRRRFKNPVDITADPWRSGQALMEFGQRVCSARPKCGECPVQPGCAGPEPAAKTRRQPRYEGSFRQRRGQLLRRVIAEGETPIADVDREAAAGLVEDGLVVLDGGHLRAPA